MRRFYLYLFFIFIFFTSRLRRTFSLDISFVPVLVSKCHYANLGILRGAETLQSGLAMSYRNEYTD